MLVRFLCLLVPGDGTFRYNFLIHCRRFQVAADFNLTTTVIKVSSLAPLHLAMSVTWPAYALEEENSPLRDHREVKKQQNRFPRKWRRRTEEKRTTAFTYGLKMLLLLSLFFVPFVQGNNNNITWGILRQAKTEQQHKHKANCEPRAREGGAVKLKRGEGRGKGACKLQPPACKMFTILQFRDSTVLLLCVVVRVTISEEEEEWWAGGIAKKKEKK